jgi:hypothetical protein
MSSVCGHTHTEAYCNMVVGKRFRVFGMQVGCGVDQLLMLLLTLRTLKNKLLAVQLY